MPYRLIIGTENYSHVRSQGTSCNLIFFQFDANESLQDSWPLQFRFGAEVPPFQPLCSITALSLVIISEKFNQIASLLAHEIYISCIKDRTQAEFESKIRWADSFVLMYSVTDKCSLDECSRLLFLIGYNKRRRRHLVISLKILISCWLHDLTVRCHLSALFHE